MKNPLSVLRALQPTDWLLRRISRLAQAQSRGNGRQIWLALAATAALLRYARRLDRGKDKTITIEPGASVLITRVSAKPAND